MASKSLGTLTLDLIAKVGGFVAGMDKAERSSAKWRKQVEKDMKAAGTAVGNGLAAAAAGATLAAGAMGAMIAQQLEVIGNQDDMAKRLNTSVESLGTLTRAAELSGVSLEQVEAASQKLDLALAKAAAGEEKQVEALDRLGLSYAELAEMPLDQRILAVNEALDALVPAAERAAVASTLFGTKAAAAIKAIDAETIAEASRQIEVLGVKLTDVESAQVEAAGDALSIFGIAADGIAKQLTVYFSPALTKLSEDFFAAAEKSGGLGTSVQQTADQIVNATAFVVSAGDGVVRVFDILSNTLVGMFATATADLQTLAANAAGALSHLPGFAGGEEFARQAAEYRAEAEINYGAAEEAAQAIRDSLEKPLAGDTLKNYLRAAREEAEAAAKEAIKAREEQADANGQASAAATELYRKQLAADEAAQAAAKEAEKSAKATAAESARAAAAIDRQVEALELQAETLGMSTKEEALFKLALDGATESQLKQAEAALDAVDAFEKAKKQQGDYKNLVSELRTEEEKRVDTLREQMAILDAMPGLETGEREKMASRVTEGLFEDAPDTGLSEVDAGPLGELSKLADAEKAQQDWYNSQLEMLGAFRQERSDLSAEWDARELELKQQHEDAMAGIERSRWQVGLDGMDSFLTQMQGLRDTDSKKGKQAAKAAAIVQATINAYTAATGAYASASAIPVVGWVMGPVAAAAALAAGLANVSAIQGMAHDGIDSVPQTGTWLLEKGERVTTAGTSAKLDATLSRIQAGMNEEGGSRNGSRGNFTLNQTNNFGSPDNRTANQVASATARRQRAASARLGS